MTWLNLLAKLVGLIMILPLILNFFPVEDVVLWYSLTSVLSIIIMFDLGYSPTFIRFYSYVMAGAKIDDLNELDNIEVKNLPAKGKVDVNSLHFINQIISNTYRKISLVAFFSMLFIGSLFLWKPISNSSDIYYGISSWLTIVVTGSLTLYGNKYTSMLQGMNEIATYQKYNSLIVVMSTGLAAILIILYQNLFLAILSIQLGAVIVVVINYFLVNKNQNTSLNSYPKLDLDKYEFSLVKSNIDRASRKSAIGIFCSTGLFQFSNIFMANSFDKVFASSYMVSMQLLRSLSAFSQVPLQTQLPTLARLYAVGNKKKLFSQLKIIFIKVIFVFLMGLVAITLGFPFLLSLLNSETPVPSNIVWISLATAIGCERFFSVLIQGYSLTNNIVWDKINGTTALAVVLFTFIGDHYFSEYAVSTAFLLSYSLIYGLLAYHLTKNFFPKDFQFFTIKLFSLLALVLLVLSLV